MNRLLHLCWFVLVPFTTLVCRGRAYSPVEMGKPALPGGRDVPPSSDHASAADPASASSIPHPPAAVTSFALVELFTSEGCSSCPAAERAVEELLKDDPTAVYVLSYHVDYWDRLGWKDPFSDSRFTARQSAYASLLQLPTIYTPQVVINGIAEFVGSDRGRLGRTVRQQLTGREPPPGDPARASINCQLSWEQGCLKIAYSVTDAPAGKLVLALVQDEADSDIHRGENAGLKMHHVRIVRDLRTVDPGYGSAVFAMPAGLTPDRFRMIAFLQMNSGPVLCITESGLPPTAAR